MTNIIAEMTRQHYLIERLCLAHCYFHDRGIKILSENLFQTQIRYLDISWCGITKFGVMDLCRLLRQNTKLEKCLL